jgi:hypothetical protein
MKKNVAFVMVWIVAMVSGAFWHKKQLPPIPQIRQLYKSLSNQQVLFHFNQGLVDIPKGQNILIKRYSVGTPVFIDRDYYDHSNIGDKRLEGLCLIQIPRHYNYPITIKAKKPLTIYRLISESNDNSIFNSYKQTDIIVNVVGASSSHTKVLKKDFSAGTILISPGGPGSASPILISFYGKPFIGHSIFKTYLNFPFIVPGVCHGLG